MFTLKPLITEKTLFAAKSHRYTFAAPVAATKPQIKAAVEKLYGVNVLKVTTGIIPGVTRHQKGHTLTSSPHKKTTVQVKPDQTIAAFELKTK